MNKKVLVTLLGAVFAIAIYWVGFINGVYYTEQKSEAAAVVSIPTDEEIMNHHIAEWYGRGFYGELVGKNQPRGWIVFNVYSEDGELQNACSVDREFYVYTFMRD